MDQQEQPSVECDQVRVYNGQYEWSVGHGHRHRCRRMLKKALDRVP
jgi:hypothetical protein